MSISANKSLSSYISVDLSGKTSFGGSQTWYSLKDKKADRNIHLYGCGLVAVCDFMLYYAKTRHVELRHLSSALTDTEHPSKDVYMDYLRLVKKKGYWLFKYFGSFSLQIRLFLGRFFKKQELPLRFRYLFRNSPKKRMSIIKKSLDADLPVILLIGPAFRKINGHKGITLYRMNDNEELVPAYTNLRKHFVTITGLYYPPEADRSVFLEIASWGQRLYVNYEELSRFIKKSSHPWLSTIIYAQESDTE